MSESFKYDDTKPLGSFLNEGLSVQYQYVNNFSFYHLIPEPYKLYYLRFVRPYFQWYDGYVPNYHTTTSNIASTRIAYTLLSQLAKTITGSKLLFDDEGTDDEEFVNYRGEDKLNSIDFTERWAEKNRLNTKIRQAVEWSMAGGDSLIKVDNVQGHLEPKVLRKDEYWFSTDFSGRISDVSMFLYERHETVKDGDEQQYYVFEERRYNDKGKPEYRISVKRGTGARPTYKDMDYHVTEPKYEQLPDKIIRDIRKNFPKAKIGVWKEMSFNSLGVYLIKATENVSFLPALPFGESLLSNNLSLLASYDYWFTAFNTDMYLAKGKILVPDLWQSNNQVDSLDQTMYTKLPYTNIDNQTPVSIQFDVRASDWSETRNNLLQLFAMNFGVNERTIATAIVPASEKPSAYEVRSDENKTTLFVDTQRTLIKPEVDRMLEDVLKFYGIKKERVFVKFSKLGITNISNIVNIVTILKQNGLIDTQTALEMVFTDKNNKQLKEIEKRLKEEGKELKDALPSQDKTVEETDEEEIKQGIDTISKPKQS